MRHQCSAISLSGTEPDAIVLAGMVEELDQSDRFGRPADQAVVQRDAHQFRRICSSWVQKVETVAQVCGEFVSSAEAVILDRNGYRWSRMKTV